jgi:predicted nucleic acid-binding protein
LPKRPLLAIIVSEIKKREKQKMSKWVEVIVTTTKLCLVEVEDNLSTTKAREVAEQVIVDNISDWDEISSEAVMHKRGVMPYDEVYKL